ncbi:hypothetical protein [Salinarimonas ramus]|uniref:Molybdopterin molybdenumtransferase n=1 Tax=Salinarimonas ramus TaxID=690164 RepID=A0A917V6Y9_9HYPH|nr:hypothetical protein [Salinarimonas ramus]GGK45106.1 molybdopterin-binding protein [Salinarimonas ramus]
MTPDASSRSLTPLDDALALWLEEVRPVATSERAPQEALGATLARDVVVEADVPARAIARRAGFAVAAADTIGASPYAPAPCLVPPARLAAGEALPTGCDAILRDDALSDGPIPEILAEVAPGTDVRRAGEEARAGTLLMPAGHRLRASDVSVLAALGIDRVAVSRPRVRLDGLALLAPLVAAFGGEVAAAGDADLVLARGGGGEGETMLVDGLALAPGETTHLARDANGMPVARLPALDGDALGAALALLPPALAALCGARVPTPLQVRLGEALTSVVGLSEIALLLREGDVWRVLAVGDLALAAYARADAYALVPPQAEGYGAGETIEARPLP